MTLNTTKEDARYEAIRQRLLSYDHMRLAHALHDIWDIMDGEEWSADTLQDVGAVLTDRLGLPINGTDPDICPNCGGTLSAPSQVNGCEHGNEEETPDLGWPDQGEP